MMEVKTLLLKKLRLLFTEHADVACISGPFSEIRVKQED